MKNRFSHVIKNISYSFSANIISTAVSILLITIVPKALTVEDYGYWQLYIFYSSYMGFFHFGLCDGVYLRNGGLDYSEIDKPNLHTQYCILTVLEVLLAAIILMFTAVLSHDSDRTFILAVIAFYCVLMTPRTFLQLLLLSTNRIRDYAQNTVMEKLLYAILVIAIIIGGGRNYKSFILADIISKTCMVLEISWKCRDIVFGKGVGMVLGLHEAWINMRVGIKLMLANMASLFIVGIVRFSIERVWGVATFGKIALSMSLSNLIMVFVNAVSTAIFPLIKRLSHEKLIKNYKSLRFAFTILALGMLSAYYPAKSIFTAWLPQYAESFRYLALLFPVCFFEGQAAMLVHTYMKALRMEKSMLKVNVASVVLSLTLTGIFVYVIKNLTLAVLTIVLVTAFRCIASEILLSREIAINMVNNLLQEIGLIVIFIASSWFLQSWWSILIYGLSYMLYLVLQRSNIRDLLKLDFLLN